MSLTFDDGPYEYTRQLLDTLDDYGVKATFFIAGNNRGKGGIDGDGNDWKSVLRRMHSAGHQLASHTWTHRNLNEVNRSVQKSEVIYNEMAFRNIFGWFPTYIRAPYLECSASSGCTDLLNTLGYHIIDSNIDTKDYENDNPELIKNSRDRFIAGVSSDARSHGYIVLAHDVHYQTVVSLAPFMIEKARELGYRLVTVGECLGDPKENWYRQASGGSGTGASHEDTTMVTSRANPSNTTKPSDGGAPSGTMTTSYAKPSKTGMVSKDKRCGGEQGQTCQFHLGSGAF
ncbi:Peptidoglycan-N-acetylglucosamine deacetylase [Escovopsis weberi]|uniref:Peptidoglycan-N-acetylglucosamine deacetylase n=1 Tax=Escovopsis weberi TaxID=150374 RepID=A0A0M8N7N0_ESCWE|nr:Peptidoglycan-N-acetylglucosamine deacetylase [Escovopsis weberi]